MAEDRLDLDPIKAREQAATIGPWKVSKDDSRDVIRSGDMIAEAYEIADAAFIAHARQDIPALIAEVTRLRAAFADILKETSHLSVNYGLRARCGEMLGIQDEPLSKEVLEAREDGIGEAVMAILKICAPHSLEAADHLRFIEGAEEPQREG